MKKRVMFRLALGCLACCLPLLAPILGVGGVGGVVSVGGWLGGLDWTTIACVGLIAAVAAGMLVFAVRRRRRADGPSCDVRE